MADFLLTLAVAGAAMGAWGGSHAARALLASLAFAFLLDWTGMPFNPLQWAMLDVAVCLYIIAHPLGRRELAIIALFVPAWLAYFVPDPVRYYTCIGVVIAQLVLAAPVELARNAWQWHCPRLRQRNRLDMVAASWRT